MGKRALFPGSFDPFTKGHEAIVHSALKLFDDIVIGIGVNSSKQYLFTVEQRLEMIQPIFHNEGDRIKVLAFEGLTVDYCQNNDIGFIVRGLRNTRDFQFEYQIANMNRALQGGIETVFLATMPEYSAINSTIVREVYKNGGDVSSFLPDGMKLP